MKLKRAISAIAALTMSVSCFAGLTITAKADDMETTIFIGIADETEDDGIKAETYESYTLNDNLYDASNNKNGWTDIEGNVTIKTNLTHVDPPSDYTTAVSTFPTYGSGSSFRISPNANNGVAAFALVSPVSKIDGKDVIVHFKSTIIAFKEGNGDSVFRGGRFIVKDNNDADIVKMDISSNSSGSYDAKLIGANNSSATFGKFPKRDQANYPYGFVMDLSINLNTQKAICSIDYVDADTKIRTKTEDKSVGISTDNVKKLYFTSWAYNNKNSGGLLLDNTKFYAELPAGLKNYTVSYRTDIDDPNTEVKSEGGQAEAGTYVTPSHATFTAENGNRYYYDNVTNEETTAIGDDTVIIIKVRQADEVNINVTSSTGVDLNQHKFVEGDDPYTYSYSKYLTDSSKKVNSKLTAGAPPYSVTLSDPLSDERRDGANLNITVDYTEYDGTAYFVEGESLTNGSTDGITSSNCSGGAAKRSFSSTYPYSKEVFVVPENGIYKVTFAALTNRSGSGGDAGIYKNSIENDAIVSVNVSYITINKVANDGTVSAENVQLLKGDKLYFKGNNGNDSLDYMLIEKTGEIDPVAAVVESAIAVVEPTGKLDTAPEFATIATNDKTTKTLSVTVYDTEETKPTLTITGMSADAFNPEWTAVTDAAAGTRTFYVQFVADDADFADFGTVTAHYGGKDITLSLVEESSGGGE